MKPIWPADLNIPAGLIPQAEVQPRIVAREVAGLTGEFLRLYFPAIAHDNSRSNGAAVGLLSDEFDLEPVVSRRRVVSQQGRRLVHIHDDDVEVSIVVEIPECTAPARMLGRYSGTRLVA